MPGTGCFASLQVPLLTFDDEMWKITQGAVYPLASLSIQLSWLIPEYCSHFSPLLLCCRVALSAFLTQFQGGGSGLSVSHRCTNKEQLFLFCFSFPQKAKLKYRLWKQAVSFSALQKDFIWHEKLYSHCLVALNINGKFKGQYNYFKSGVSCPNQFLWSDHYWTIGHTFYDLYSDVP